MSFYLNLPKLFSELKHKKANDFNTVYLNKTYATVSRE